MHDVNKPGDGYHSVIRFALYMQEHRFTDREQAHLFQAVQVHATAATSTSASGAPPPEQLKEAGLALVEDALKMPFNVFGERGAVVGRCCEAAS